MCPKSPRIKETHGDKRFCFLTTRKENMRLANGAFHLQARQHPASRNETQQVCKETKGKGEQYFFFQWRNSPQRARASSLSGLHDHTQTHITAGLLWTSDRPVAGTSTWQHTALIRDDIHAPGGIRTRNSRKRGTADPRLRPHGHWGSAARVLGSVIRIECGPCMLWIANWTAI
jgi:hypothetical protein